MRRWRLGRHPTRWA